MSRGKERVGHDHADEPESCDAKLAGSGPRHGQNLAGQRDQTGTLTTDAPTATSLSNACRRAPRTATLRDAAGPTPERRGHDSGPARVRKEWKVRPERPRPLWTRWWVRWPR